MQYNINCKLKVRYYDKLSFYLNERNTPMAKMRKETVMAAENKEKVVYRLT